MKAASHPFWSRSKFGFHYEKLLKEKIESVIGESIQKTTYSGDMMDFESKNYFIELKSRGDQYHYSQAFIKKDGWLLPFCKIEYPPWHQDGQRQIYIPEKCWTQV